VATINCPYCGKLTDSKLDACVHCRQTLKKGQGASSQTCQTCGALVREGDIICVACGTNLLTGQRIADEKPIAESGGNRLLVIIIGVVVALAVIIGLVLAAMFLLRDPVKQALKLQSESRLSEARTVLKEHLAKHPDDARGQFELGRMHWSTREYREAAGAFRNAAKIDPDDRKAALFAMLSLARASGDTSLQGQTELLEGITSTTPDDAEALHLLALARGASGDAAGQAGAAEAALEHLPGDGSLRASLGLARAMEDATEEAASDLTAAQSGSPDDADLTAALGLVAIADGDTKKAESKLRAALDGGTSIEQHVLTELGLLLMAQSRYDEAEGLLNTAIAMGNPPPEALFFHAASLQAQNLYQSALPEFESLAKQSGPYAEKAAIHAAQIQMELGNPEKAAILVQGVRAGGSAEAHTLLGRIAIDNGDVSRAREAFRSAIKADPAYAPAYLERGLLAVRRDQVAEGVGDLERYLKLADPDDPVARAKDVAALLEQLQRSVESDSVPLNESARRTQP
jgi:tetratricopeptide (TPR) repeat protein